LSALGGASIRETQDGVATPLPPNANVAKRITGWQYDRKVNATIFFALR
jgi:hypothetical protein